MGSIYDTADDDTANRSGVGPRAVLRGALLDGGGDSGGDDGDDASATGGGSSSRASDDGGDSSGGRCSHEVAPSPSPTVWPAVPVADAVGDADAAADVRAVGDDYVTTSRSSFGARSRRAPRRGATPPYDSLSAEQWDYLHALSTGITHLEDDTTALTNVTLLEPNVSGNWTNASLANASFKNVSLIENVTTTRHYSESTISSYRTMMAEALIPLDNAVAALLDALGAGGMLDDAIIFVHSDNGGDWPPQQGVPRG